MRLLLVEDEDAIAVPLADGLRREGFTSSARGHRPRGPRSPGRISSSSTSACRTRTASPSAASYGADRVSPSSWSRRRARRSTESSVSRSVPTTTSSSLSGSASSLHGFAQSPGVPASVQRRCRSWSVGRCASTPGVGASTSRSARSSSRPRSSICSRCWRTIPEQSCRAPESSRTSGRRRGTGARRPSTSTSRRSARS